MKISSSFPKVFILSMFSAVFLTFLVLTQLGVNSGAIVSQMLPHQGNMAKGFSQVDNAVNHGITKGNLSFSPALVMSDMSSLLQRHEKFVLQTDNHSAFHGKILPEQFFADIRLIADQQAQNFFKNMVISTTGAGVQVTKAYMSYTRSQYINGKMQSISYEYSSSGNKVKMVKSTNNDGRFIRAVYNYNIHDRGLRVEELYRPNVDEKRVVPQTRTRYYEI